MADRGRIAAALAYQQGQQNPFDAVPVAGVKQPLTPNEMTWMDRLNNLSAGLGQGIEGQLEGYKQLVAHPVQSAKDTVQALGTMVKNPSVIVDALKGMGERAMSGSQGLGEVVGENMTLNPRKLAMALSHPKVAEMTVYHGTPHRFPATEANPLGEFDASKIGTGEGAQAYGHGIYVAESPGVAKSYQTDLSKPSFEFAGQHLNFGSKEASEVLRKAGYSDEAIDSAILAMQGFKGADYSALTSDLSEGIKRFPKEFIDWNAHNQQMEILGKSKPVRGNLYHVDLPDPMIEKMLDWDKPLSEQPHIQRALLNQDEAWKAYANKLSPENRKLAENMVLGNEPVYGDIADKHWNKLQKSNPELDHNQIHDTRYLINPKTDDQDWLMSVLSGNAAPGAGVRGGGGADLYNSFGGGAKASEALRQLGIPGIRYLDAGSRGATDTGRWELKFKDGTSKVFDFKPNDDVLASMGATASPIGTRNFVIFPGEEKNLKILERK